MIPLAVDANKFTYQKPFSQLASVLIDSFAVGTYDSSRGCIVDYETPITAPIIALVLNSFNHWVPILMDSPVFAPAFKLISSYLLKFLIS
jgi:hypothetical protein